MSTLLDGMPVALGGTRGFDVTRTLPHRGRRMVGAWCFLDAYGPASQVMRVPPHPHTGLQTVSWLVSGEILHRDSLGNECSIRPGQLNLMTAGRGIAHSEDSRSALLHGVQLWVALPHADRDMAPAFAHHSDLPGFSDGGMVATVLMGTLAGVTSPAAIHTPLMGAEIALAPGSSVSMPLRDSFEYAILALDGSVAVDGAPLSPGPLLYLPPGSSSVELSSLPGGRILLLGGEPFDEKLVMWWNFVARDHDEIVQMRADWVDQTPRFGTMPGPSLPAPAMPITRLVPRGRA